MFIIVIAGIAVSFFIWASYEKSKNAQRRVRKYTFYTSNIVHNPKKAHEVSVFLQQHSGIHDVGFDSEFSGHVEVYVDQAFLTRTDVRNLLISTGAGQVQNR